MPSTTDTNKLQKLKKSKKKSEWATLWLYSETDKLDIFCVYLSVCVWSFRRTHWLFFFSVLFLVLTRSWLAGSHFATQPTNVFRKPTFDWSPEIYCHCRYEFRIQKKTRRKQSAYRTYLVCAIWARPHMMCVCVCLFFIFSRCKQLFRPSIPWPLAATAVASAATVRH